MLRRGEFNGRRAAVLENGVLRVAVLEGGGHIAAVQDLASGISPLWVPPWPSIEPERFGPEHAAEYGGAVEGRLLAGIMGHNLCLDIFGGPSPEEAQAGLTPHGEASVATYGIEEASDGLVMRAELPLAQLRVARRLRLDGDVIHVHEMVENRGGTDRPVGWTQHVTLGPPFLEAGATQFRASATRSCVFDGTFGADDYLAAGATFDWPNAPLAAGGTISLEAPDDGCRHERLHGASDGPAAADRVRRRVLAAPSAGVRLRVGHRAISRGWGSGKRTTAGCRPPGMARPSRAAWSSACLRFRSRAGRWSSATACSGCRRTGGCRPAPG